ncbi:response regulator transcription factor [Ignatzschineria sp. LJL83]
MKILIAEDDPNIRFGLEQALKSEGYELILAENGAIALEKFQAENPDFIILDIMMPVKDGYSVCREIRKVNDHVPILFLSAKDEEVDRVIGLELGADDYLGKPFGIHEIRARIKAILKRCHRNNAGNLNNMRNSGDFGNGDNLDLDHLNNASGKRKKTIQLGDWEISPANLTATKEHKVISLTIREMKIIELLVQEENNIVTRDALFNHAWGYDFMPNSRTLDQHISKIRKLFEEDPQNPALIKTVHGMGYRYCRN